MNVLFLGKVVMIFEDGLECLVDYDEHNHKAAFLVPFESAVTVEGITKEDWDEFVRDCYAYHA